MNVAKLPQRLEVFGTSPEVLRERLSAAEAAIRQSVMENRKAGVLVTRYDFQRFTVEASDAVPFGETRELSVF